MSVNKVILVGNVGKDPDIRYFDNGNAQDNRNKVANLTLATTEKYRDRNGQIQEQTEWHNVVGRGQPADVIEKFVKKGSQIYVEGKLRTRSWTDVNGVKKYTTEIIIDNLQLLGRRPDAEQGQSYSQPAQQPQAPAYQAPQPAAPQPAAPQAADQASVNDDLPF